MEIGGLQCREWWNHNEHLAMHFGSLMTSTKNLRGWNVEWNKEMFYNNELLLVVAICHQL